MPDGDPGEGRVRHLPLRRLLLLIPLLLAVAVGVNWKDLAAIAQGQKTLKSVLYGRDLTHSRPNFRFPPPAGPTDARVKVKVVAQEGNSCHRPLVALWLGVSDLEPQRVRVEFANGMGPSPGPSKSQPQLGCESGALINGKNKFVLGEGKSQRTLYLTGPMPAPPSPPKGAPPPHGSHGWTLDDVASIVNQALKQTYGRPGALSGKALSQAMAAADARIPAAATDSGKAGDER